MARGTYTSQFGTTAGLRRSSGHTRPTSHVFVSCTRIRKYIPSTLESQLFTFAFALKINGRGRRMSGFHSFERAFQLRNHVLLSGYGFFHTFLQIGGHRSAGDTQQREVLNDATHGPTRRHSLARVLRGERPSRAERCIPKRHTAAAFSSSLRSPVTI